MIATDRYRVLAVDDSEDVLELIRVSLQGEYDVVTLSDPVDLYEVMDVFEPDLLILDIMMPRINGFQLIEMLRKSPSTKELPILVLSAKTSPGEIKHGYKLGATLYLTKPFQPERLRKNLETQFRVHPPSEGKKSITGPQLWVQLEMTPSHRRNHLRLPDNVGKQETYFSARKKVEEKIRKEQNEEVAGKREWRG